MTTLPYELAKKLKDAGFPRGRNEGRLSDSDVYFPTLRELIDACGDKTKNGWFELMKFGDDECFMAHAGIKTGEKFVHFEGKDIIPEIAVANLYLALNEKKDE